MKNVLLFALLFATAPIFSQTADVMTDTLLMPEITFDKLSHDFGTLPKGGNTTTRFYFRNTGKSPLIISKCGVSCGCTTPKCPTEAIMPGQQSFVDVHYDSMRVGQFTKTVTVSSNAKTKDIVLKISGTITDDTNKTSPVDEKKSILTPKQ